MKIGIPKEVKNNENRVAVTPVGVSEFVKHGHIVYIEHNAGIGSGFADEHYINAGAISLSSAREVWESADMIMKVKEPISSEYVYFRKGLVLFTYLHLAAEPALTKALVDSGVTAIAYETVNVNNTLPLLTPMSEVAGRMSAQIGAQLLEKTHGGKGILLSGIPGVPRAKVAIIGGGVVGMNAAKVAIGLGAQVTLLDISVDRLRQLEDIFGSAIQTLISSPSNIMKATSESDLLICAVLIPGARAPKLVPEGAVKSMSPGSVIVDVAIDQGGIVETIDHVTTHDNPTYVKHGVLHYAVSNMPGAVPRTSTLGLTNVTLPFALQIADLGVVEAIRGNSAIRSGANVVNGCVTFEAVAKAVGYEYVAAEVAIDRGKAQ